MLIAVPASMLEGGSVAVLGVVCSDFPAKKGCQGGKRLSASGCFHLFLSMALYYVDAERQRQGPLSEKEFTDAVQSGTVSPETLVWRDGMAEWVPYGTVRDNFISGRGLAADTLTVGGATVSERDTQEIAQRIKEGAKLSEHDWEYGGFWIRAGALFVDILILMAIQIGLGFLYVLAFAGGDFLDSDPFMDIIGHVVGAAYFIFFHGTRKFQATPGKMLFKLRVIVDDGSDVSYLRALGRNMATWLSAIPLGAGYIVAAFDDEKRTWHDRLASTRVIRR